MFMLDYRDLSWRYWLVTVSLLSAGMTGWSAGFHLAIALTLLQLVHFTLREGSLTAFPVQVRIAYLLLLLLALPENHQALYWLPTLGTWARVIFGYCTLARTVSLLPWNRREALSLALLKRTYISAPVRGSIMQGLPPN